MHIHKSQYFFHFKRIAVPIIFTAVTLWSLLTFFLVIYGWPLDKSSAKYVEMNVPIFLNTKTKDSFLKIASPELASALNDKELEFLLHNLSFLGHLNWNSRFIGNATYDIGSENKASYIAIALFDSSYANIEVELIQHNNKWTIYRLDISVPIKDEVRTVGFNKEFKIPANKSVKQTD